MSQLCNMILMTQNTSPYREKLKNSHLSCQSVSWDVASIERQRESKRWLVGTPARTVLYMALPAVKLIYLLWNNIRHHYCPIDARTAPRLWLIGTTSRARRAWGTCGVSRDDGPQFGHLFGGRGTFPND